MVRANQRLEKIFGFDPVRINQHIPASKNLEDRVVYRPGEESRISWLFPADMSRNHSCVKILITIGSVLPLWGLLRISRHIFHDACLGIHSCLLDLPKLLLGHCLHR